MFSGDRTCRPEVETRIAQEEMAFSISDYEAACNAITGTRGNLHFAFQFLAWLFNLKLTRREKQLLGTFAGHEILQLVKYESNLAIAINSIVIDHQQALMQREYLEALMRLCRRGYLNSLSDGMFALSVVGMKKAEKLAKKGWRAELSENSQ